MSSKRKSSAVAGGEASLVPERRFPEFQDAGDWESVSLGSLVSISTEKVGDKSCVPMSITSGVGLVSQMEKFGRVIAGDSYRNYLQLQKNDFAYNKSATKEYPEGFIAHYTGDELAAVPNSIFTCFRIHGKTASPRYLNYLFLGNLHGRWLRKFIEVGARAHGSLSINNSDLLALPVPVPGGPNSLKEQQKIADCLDSADALIAAQRRKVEALKAHKKGLMQQLFPHEGETQPRLRFPEFENSEGWELKLGGELFANRKEKGEAGLPIYSVTINDGMVPRSSFDRNFYDIEDPTANRKAHRGDIAYNMMRMWQGAQGVAPENCLVSPAYVVLKPRSGACSDFFAYFFKLPQSLQLLTVTSRGLTKDRLRLYFDDFAKMPLRVPGKPEQQRIADCLLSLDTLITAETGKLDRLKTHKKGLMQQLFPAIEEFES
jgi:type I restriction enzyme S subunit